MSSFCLSPVASLDDSLARLYESLEKLKAANSVDFAEVIEQLKMAAEFARIVRELVWSELPQASWQNREELDALVEKIQEILDARTLAQLRSRLLALATELECGSIVHRRALRVNELNRLREQAVNELRSQAGLERTPPTLPGPQADRWIAWACGLQEPEDAESLQTLRIGFAHLDDFVANLEPNMWVAAGSPTFETMPEAERSADTAQPEQLPLETKGFEEPAVSADPMQIGLEAAKSTGRRDESLFPHPLDELSLSALESNTLTPNDVTLPRTEEEIQRIQAQERALLASMMGLVSDPVGHFNHPLEPPFAPEAFCETNVAPATLVSEPVGTFDRSVEHPVTAKVSREISATPASLADDLVAPFNPPVERPFTTEVSGETSAAPASTADIATRVEKHGGRKWRVLLTTPGALLLAALLLFAALGAIVWRSHRNHAVNGS
jgi:hypothetical protein